MKVNTQEAIRLITECEDRYLSDIARCVREATERKGLQYIALCGPTCSGKTTTADILVRSLNEAGRSAEVISIDDFFRNREDILAEARDKNEKPDLDSVRAIDLHALRTFMESIENEEDAFLPHYDFVKGQRDGGRKVSFCHGRIYIFEGIQAFYPEVVSVFKSEELLKVFISVTDGYCLEDTCFTAREMRLMRRMLRDSRTRGTDAPSTLAQWEKVVKNELLHIDPHSEIADVTVNSSMPYEVGVMKNMILPLLRTLPECEIRERAIRLYSLSDEIDPSLVPRGSVIREFIG